MWFKNIQVYKLSNATEVGELKLEELLKSMKFIPCSKRDMMKTGWVSILGDEEDKLTQKVGSNYFLKLRTESKVIPSGTIKEKLEERTKVYMQENEGKKPSKDIKKEFKEAIVLSMCETAFTKSSFLDAYIDYKNKYLIVNASSKNSAESLIGYLRQTIGSLEATILEPEDDPTSKMTSWVSMMEAPQKFSFGLKSDLKSLDGGAVSIKKHEVDCEEVKNHLDNGMKVVKVEMVWQKRIRFILTDKFEIKSIKSEDIVSESIDQELGESKDINSKFMSNMTIMTGDFAELIEDLVESV